MLFAFSLSSAPVSFLSLALNILSQVLFCSIVWFYKLTRYQGPFVFVVVVPYFHIMVTVCQISVVYVVVHFMTPLSIFRLLLVIMLTFDVSLQRADTDCIAFLMVSITQCLKLSLLSDLIHVYLLVLLDIIVSVFRMKFISSDILSPRMMMISIFQVPALCYFLSTGIPFPGIHLLQLLATNLYNNDQIIVQTKIGSSTEPLDTTHSKFYSFSLELYFRPQNNFLLG